ncbi:MAG: flagellar hook-basal body protein [Jatrophihabitans sp.]|uniref:flagellar hook-basal body protein n=1 Tax=Jatrophihabitans sp. TaxID=1932789 RepID=UPI003F7FBDD8
MLRSLFTAISGLSAHQKMLDVTANNIANVNTTGFKSSSAIFEDTLSQTLTGGGGSSATSGGTNPSQIGLGVKFAGEATNFTQGSYQTTGVPSNMLINGDGFFAVQKNGQQQFSRAGGFTLDDAGHLVLPDGAELEDANGAVISLPGLVDGTYSSYSIDQNGNINAVDSTGTTTTLAQVGLATFANPGGLSKAGDTSYLATTASGAPTIAAPNTGSAGSITSGYVEMSNVDLAQELTNLIIAQRGYQANGKVITTSDEVLQTLVNLKQ